MNSFIDDPTAGRAAAFQTPASLWSRRVSTLLMCSVFFVCLWCAGVAFSDDGGRGEATSSGKATAVQVVDVDLRSLPAIPAAKVERLVGVAPTRRTGDGVDSVAEPTFFHDPLEYEQLRVWAKATGSLTVDVNVAGVGFTGATPADAVGEVGGAHFVQMVNGPGGAVFAVYDTATGGLVAGPAALDGLWRGAGACAEGWGHPGVIHDALADRWVLSELGAGNHLCVYVSKTANPVTGGWHAYDFDFQNFPDFARIGAWVDGYSVTTNEDLPAVYALERQAMLDGAAARWQRFTVQSLGGFGFQALAPADLDGESLPAVGRGGLFVRHADGQAHGGGDRLELYELDINWGAPQSSNLSGPATLSMASFDSSLCGFTARECVPQPHSAVMLDPMREVVMGAVRYRKFDSHESLVGNFAVDTDASDHAGIRWFELRRSGDSWTIYQEGTFSPDDSHRWIGSAAINGDGSLALAYNVADESSTYPSIRVTGREEADTPGVMTASELEIQAGSSAQTVGHSPEQWGASNSLSVDPTDACTFWVTAAFAEDGGWNTRVASFRFPSCETLASDLIFADGFESVDTSAWTGSAP